MKKTLSVVLCFVLCALGVILAFCFHGGATAEAASGANKVLFALSVILAVGMLAAGVANLLPQKKATDVDAEPRNWSDCPALAESVPEITSEPTLPRRALATETLPAPGIRASPDTDETEDVTIFFSIVP